VFTSQVQEDGLKSQQAHKDNLAFDE